MSLRLCELQDPPSFSRYSPVCRAKRIGEQTPFLSIQRIYILDDSRCSRRRGLTICCTDCKQCFSCSIEVRSKLYWFCYSITLSYLLSALLSLLCTRLCLERFTDFCIYGCILNKNEWMHVVLDSFRGRLDYSRYSILLTETTCENLNDSDRQWPSKCPRHLYFIHKLM